LGYFSEEELAQARITAGLSAVEKAALERAAEHDGKVKRQIAGQNVRVYFFTKITNSVDLIYRNECYPLIRMRTIWNRRM
jgi:hypothetical protein